MELKISLVLVAEVVDFGLSCLLVIVFFYRNSYACDAAYFRPLQTMFLLTYYENYFKDLSLNNLFSWFTSQDCRIGIWKKCSVMMTEIIVTNMLKFRKAHFISWYRK
jgi:hypothetical protein